MSKICYLFIYLFILKIPMIAKSLDSSLNMESKRFLLLRRASKDFSFKITEVYREIMLKLADDCSISGDSSFKYYL